ncbi:MAG: outer membrane beta-barrel protein [Gammaproteobacteria bacterium]
MPVASAATIPRESGDPFAIALSEQLTQDNNLYRLPGDVNMADLVPGSNASRDDVLSRTSAIADGAWDFGKQAVALNVALDSNRYADNDDLNNTSGTGRADWNWRMGRDWSGQIGGSYGRSLSGFVNSRFFGKDLLETNDYHAGARYELTPHWSLAAKTRHGEGSHDTDARQVDNFTSQTNTFTVGYLTRRADELGLEYRNTRTSFPNEQPGGGSFSDRDYIDRAANFKINYAFTVKTSFEGSVGYLWRHYPQSVFGDFAGAVWKGTLHWEPRSKTRVELTQWQDLTAYLDAESNHFEARGTRLTLGWLVSTKLTLSLDVSRENHDYTGFDPASFDQPSRRDKLWSQQATLSYTPSQMLAFDFTYRFEKRDTNRTFYQYDDRSLSVGVSFIF